MKVKAKRTNKICLFWCLLLLGLVFISWVALNKSNTGLQSADLLQYQWRFMPRSQFQNQKLRVLNLKSEVVGLDNNQYYEYPPINRLGAHLTDFDSISMKMTIEDIGPIGQPVKISFYPTLPILLDENVLPVEAFELYLGQGQINASLFQQNVTKPLPIRSSHLLKLEVNPAKISLTVDDQFIGLIEHNNFFKKRTMWFGLKAQTNDWTLRNFMVKAKDAKGFKVADGSLAPKYEPNSENLQSLAAVSRRGMTVGAAAAIGPLAADQRYQQLMLGGNFGSITPENALKWQFIEPEANVFDFNEMDGLLNLASQNSIQIHGHTLVFGEANPYWVNQLAKTSDNSKTKASAALQNHIQKVVSHYKGLIKTWDLINEPLADYGSFSEDQPLRQHIWQQLLGPDYLAIAVDAARQADPAAELYINEFGLEDDGPRWQAMLNLIDNLERTGHKIDGIGFQAHIINPDDIVDIDQLSGHFEQLAKRGLKVRVSELEVNAELSTKIQSSQFAAIFRTCLKASNCQSVTTWGATDKYNYFLNQNRVEMGRSLLWDAKLNPRPALSAVKHALTAEY